MLRELPSPWGRSSGWPGPHWGTHGPSLSFQRPCVGCLQTALAVLGPGWGGRWPPSLPRPVPSSRHRGTSGHGWRTAPSPTNPIASRRVQCLEVPGTPGLGQPCPCACHCPELLPQAASAVPHRAPQGRGDVLQQSCLPVCVCGAVLCASRHSCRKEVQGSAPCAHPARRSRDARSVSKSKRHKPDIFLQ